MVSMVTATTAQVSHCFIFLLKISNRRPTHLIFFLVVECLRTFCYEELMFIESSAMGLVRVNEIPVKSIIGKAAVNIILLDILLYIKHNTLFHRYGGHVEFKEYYGMPRGHSLSISARFLGKKRTLLYISGEKSDHYYIQTRHNDFFSHYNLFLGKLKEKLARKARVNTERVYWIVLMPPGHPIILLKSKLFNMATVSVKRSISHDLSTNSLHA